MTALRAGPCRSYCSMRSRYLSARVRAVKAPVADVELADPWDAGPCEDLSGWPTQAEFDAAMDEAYGDEDRTYDPDGPGDPDEPGHTLTPAA